MRLTTLMFTCVAASGCGTGERACEDDGIGGTGRVTIKNKFEDQAFDVHFSGDIGSFGQATIPPGESESFDLTRTSYQVWMEPVGGGPVLCSYSDVVVSRCSKETLSCPDA